MCGFLDWGGDGADFEKEARAAEMRARPHYEAIREHMLHQPDGEATGFEFVGFLCN